MLTGTDSESSPIVPVFEVVKFLPYLRNYPPFTVFSLK
jgi:hypothetical protein